MKVFGKKAGKVTSTEGRCDTRVWSGACEKSDYTDSSDKYLCTECGTLSNLTHEVRHEFYSQVCGDYDNLS